MQSLKEKKGMGAVVKQLGQLQEREAVAVPAPTAIANRAMREVGYEKTKEEVSKWQPIVNQNRNKEQLTFPLKDPGRYNLSATTLSTSFTPRTALESEASRASALALRASFRRIKPSEHQCALTFACVSRVPDCCVQPCGTALTHGAALSCPHDSHRALMIHKVQLQLRCSICVLC